MQLKSLSKRLWGLLRKTFQASRQARAAEAAAGMAYYALLSLFPLLLSLAMLGSFFLESERAYQVVVETVTETLPTSQGLVEDTIQDALQRRGAVGIVGLVGLLWSGGGVFVTLMRNVNRAWTEAEARSFVGRRLIALVMVAALASLLVLSVLLAAALDLLRLTTSALLGTASGQGPSVWILVSEMVPFVIAFLTFAAIYRWLPNAPVSGSAALWGALPTAIAWEAIRRGFGWYLGSGLARYEWVYGSLAAVVALMLWVYLGGWTVLLGAHLSAALDRSGKRSTD